MTIEGELSELRRIYSELLRRLDGGVSGQELFDRREAAKRLGISPTLLSRLKAMGLVQTVPRGRRWAVPAREIARLAREGVDTRPGAPGGKTGSAGAKLVRERLRRR